MGQRLLGRLLNVSRFLPKLKSGPLNRSATNHLSEVLAAIASPSDCAVAQNVDISSRFVSCLGRIPKRPPLEPVIVSCRKQAGVLYESVAFMGGETYRIHGFLVHSSEASEKHAGLIAIHGHGGNYDQGKEKIFKTRSGNPTYGYGLRLVEAGFAVFAIDLLGFGERQVRPLENETPWPQDMDRFIFCTLLLHGATLAGIHLFDLSKAVDYMASRSDIVDPNCIGVIGHSMGGTLAPLLMLFDERVKVGVSASGLSTWREMIDKQVIHNYGVYLPGLLPNGDLDDLCAQIAPRPFMMIAGEKDPNFPLEGVRSIERKMREQYIKQGAEQALEVLIHPGGHPFEIEQQDMAWRFLQKWLCSAEQEKKDSEQEKDKS